MDGPVYLNLEYAYMNLSIYIYCWRQKCLEPRIIYIYLCINTCLHTHEMQMYLYDVKFGSITAYISPPVLHTNCFIASSAQIWGGFFRSPEANEQPGVSRSSRGHTFHFPRGWRIFFGMDGWQKVGNKLFGRFMDPGHVKKKRPDFQGFLQQTSLVCLGLVSCVNICSTWIECKMYANSQEKRLIDMAPWMAP